jgi:hypothetical protein
LNPSALVSRYGNASPRKLKSDGKRSNQKADQESAIIKSTLKISKTVKLTTQDEHTMTSSSDDSAHLQFDSQTAEERSGKTEEKRERRRKKKETEGILRRRTGLPCHCRTE